MDSTTFELTVVFQTKWRHPLGFKKRPTVPGVPDTPENVFAAIFKPEQVKERIAERKRQKP